MATQIAKNPPIYRIFSFILRLGEFLGILPLQFIENVGKSTMRFHWKSYKTIYSIVQLIVTVLMVFFCIYSAQEAETSWTFRHIVRTLFYASSLGCAVSFLLITKRWPQLMDKWMILDQTMEHSYGFPKNLNRRTKLTAMVSILYTIGQVILFVIYNVQNTKNIASSQQVKFEHSIYFKTVFSQVFQHIPYYFILGLLCQLTFVFCVWRLAYTDLFISLISSFLSIRFEQVTNRLRLALNKKRTIAFWREIREDYDRICLFCKEVDDVITNIVFVSYTANLILLLVYLRNCTIVEGMTIEKIYNIICFIIYLTRIFVISLYVSWVNDASKDPSYILNSVSTAEYNSEIQRFLQQISFNNVAFTGNKMFKVTRTLILNIGGIILTYELVLVQFAAFKFS